MSLEEENVRLQRMMTDMAAQLEVVQARRLAATQRLFTLSEELQKTQREVDYLRAKVGELEDNLAASRDHRVCAKKVEFLEQDNAVLMADLATVRATLAATCRSEEGETGDEEVKRWRDIAEMINRVEDELPADCPVCGWGLPGPHHANCRLFAALCELASACHGLRAEADELRKLAWRWCIEARQLEELRSKVLVFWWGRGR